MLAMLKGIFSLQIPLSLPYIINNKFAPVFRSRNPPNLIITDEGGRLLSHPKIKSWDIDAFLQRKIFDTK